VSGGRHRRDDSAEDRPQENPHAERISTAELDRLVRNFYGTKTLIFDRPLAEAVLVYNTGNRRVTRRKLEVLANQMRSGAFENTGEPIIFSAEGVLNNGQHRLLAVVESEAVVDMDVRFGIPRKTFTKTDTGAPRSGGDVLTIAGVAHGGMVSSAVRLLILYKRGLPDSIREFVSNDEIARAYRRWSGIADVAQQIAAHHFPKGVRSTPLLATAYLASRSSGKAKLDGWLHTLATGEDVRRDNPVYQLRERLMHGIEAPIGTREGLLERMALMIKSWNLYAAGETVPMRSFQWKAKGRGGEPFPHVEGVRLPAHDGAD
jgi:hypothetical protein